MSACTRPRPSPAGSGPDGATAESRSPPGTSAPGPREAGCPTRPTRPSRRGGSSVAMNELEVTRRPAGTDPQPRLPVLAERVVAPFRRGTPPEPRPATGFYTDTTVCIGCKGWEVACKQWNQLPADGFAWTGNSYHNTGGLSATSWRHVKFIEQFPLISAPPPQRDRRDKETALPAGGTGRG